MTDTRTAGVLTPGRPTESFTASHGCPDCNADLRQDGQTDAVAAMSHPDRQAATAAGADLVATGRPWTVDDLRDRVEPLALSGSNSCWGGLIASWSKAGVIRCCGVTESRRRPGAFVRTWIGVTS